MIVLLKGPNDLVFDLAAAASGSPITARTARATATAPASSTRGRTGLRQSSRPSSRLTPVRTESGSRRAQWIASTWPRDVDSAAVFYWWTSTTPGAFHPPQRLARPTAATSSAGVGGLQLFDSLAIDGDGNVCVLYHRQRRHHRDHHPSGRSARARPPAPTRSPPTSVSAGPTCAPPTSRCRERASWCGLGLAAAGARH